MDRLGFVCPDLDGEGRAQNADLIIEAVPGKARPSSRKSMGGLEPNMKPGAILAHQHLEHSAAGLRATLQDRSGWSACIFFNPVSAAANWSRLVSHDGTDPQILKAALAFVGAIDRLPLPVKSSPGVPRQPRADALHAGGDDDAGREDRQAHHRCGGGKIRHADGPRSNWPTRSASTSASRSATCCVRNSGDQLPPTPACCATRSPAAIWAARPARAFIAGRTAKADKGSALSSSSEPTTEMIDRLVLPMSNVCVACLREGIVDNADLIDGAMIFGTPATRRSAAAR